MSKQISIKPFIYRGNPVTLGQRFEEWLEIRMAEKDYIRNNEKINLNL